VVWRVGVRSASESSRRASAAVAIRLVQASASVIVCLYWFLNEDLYCCTSFQAHLASSATPCACCHIMPTAARASCCTCIRRHTSAYFSTRQHTSTHVSTRQHTSAHVSIRQHTSAYVSIRQHTSAARDPHHTCSSRITLSSASTLSPSATRSCRRAPTYKRTHAHTHTHKHLYTISIHTQTHTHTHTHTHTLTHTCVYIHTYISIHIHTYAAPLPTPS
jgi:hypothetical protein